MTRKLSSRFKSPEKALGNYPEQPQMYHSPTPVEEISILSDGSQVSTGDTQSPFLLDCLTSKQSICTSPANSFEITTADPIMTSFQALAPNEQLEFMSEAFSTYDARKSNIDQLATSYSSTCPMAMANRARGTCCS